ncbi:MAG: DsbA family protein [Alphaproteobacteria bacterium]|nr:DsbA family protein [Alphaproteobacteria bacterium]
MAETGEVKMYTDFKSPYAFLAFAPAYELEERFDITMAWKPFQLRIKGRGQRSVYSEWKVRYSYMDARRNANRRGGLMLRGPLKVFDTTPALVGGLFADRHGRFREYGGLVFEGFFRREFAADEPDAVAGVLDGMGLSGDEYRTFLEGEGMAQYEAIQEEAVTDNIFGVPLFVFSGEQFWGHDRLWLLEERLAEAGLARA